MDTDRVRVLSFNVNGLRAVLKRLYGPNATVGRLLNDLGRGADVVCLQETKLRRVELASSPELALADGWESFFSCANSSRGYSGTATFCRAARCMPCAAGEGVSGGCAPSSGGGGSDGRWLAGEVHEDLVDEFTAQEMQNLDSEGRVVVTDHSAFVLFNVYGPAITSEDAKQARQRMAFKLRFFAALQRRWDGLLARGRAVVVVGDLNIAPSPLDYPDVDPDFYRAARPDRRWLRGLLGHDSRGGSASGRGAGGPPPFVDCFRHFFPGRRGAFSVWSTATGARANNYGSRIDLCLAAGLAVGAPRRPDSAAAPRAGEAAAAASSAAAASRGAGAACGASGAWVSGSDIQPDVQGSDHCPVWVDVCHPAPFPCCAAPPPCAARFMFGGKQTRLHQWFGSSGEAATGAGGVSSGGCQQASQAAGCALEARDATESMAPQRQLEQGQGPGDGRKAGVGLSGGGKQASLKVFLQPPPQPVSRQHPKLTGGTQLPGTPPSSGAAAAAAAAAPLPSPTFIQAELTAASASRESDASSAWQAWQLIQQRMAVPNCRHGEPAALKRVGKSGPNHGRYFYMCSRAEGKGRHAQCSFFQWVERRAGDVGGGAAAGAGAAAKRLKLQ